MLPALSGVLVSAMKSCTHRLGPLGGSRVTQVQVCLLVEQAYPMAAVSEWVCLYLGHFFFFFFF